MNVPRVLFNGILGGALVGLLIGFYVVLLTTGHVVRRVDFNLAIEFEEAKTRFSWTVLLAFVVVFSFIGPLIASASFGPWVRHAVYGLVVSIGLIVGVALGVAL